MPFGMAGATVPAREIYAAELESGAPWQSGSEEDQLTAGVAVPPRRRFGVGLRALAGAALGVAGVAAVVASASHTSGRAIRPGAATKDDVELFGVAMLAASAASTLASSATIAKDVETMSPDIEKAAASVMHPLQKLKEQMQVRPGVSAYKVNLTEMNNLSKQDLLKPKAEDRNDGNICADDEELHANLCYKRCADLTNGQYPIRTTAFACCMEEPCSFFNSKFTSPLHYCSGFDVSGNAEGKECPHAPGDCMVNEEFHLGQCYQKCAILTNNSFTFRSAPSTCCRYANHLACIDALNTLTRPEYDVGGGIGDGRNSTPNMPHAPLEQLTEHGLANVTQVPNMPTPLPTPLPTTVAPAAETA